MGEFDEELILGFVQEVRSYLPKIEKNVALFRAGAGDPALLKEAQRHFHVVKGAASMIGLTGLGHLAYAAEESLAEVLEGRASPVNEQLDGVLSTVGQIEAALQEALVSASSGQFSLDAVALEDLPTELPTAEAFESPETPWTASGRAEAVPDPLHLELLESFLQEAEDHLTSITRCLPLLQDATAAPGAIQEMRRSVHTLKGAAGVVEAGPVVQAAHRMEDLLDLLFEGGMALSEPVRELLVRSTDVLADLVAGTLSGRSVPQSILNSLYSSYDELLGDRETEPVPEPAAFEPVAVVTEPVAADEGPAAASQGAQTIRVPIGRFDEASKLLGESFINASSFEQHFRRLIQQADEMEHSLARLRRLTLRLETQYETFTMPRGQLAVAGTGFATPHDFDELEFDRYTEFHLLSRELTETSADLLTVGNGLRDTIGDFDGYLIRQRRLNGELQNKLLALRLVPVRVLTRRLLQAVRVTSAKRGKQVNLVIEGEHVELDKSVLEAVADPLLHLLTNAVEHGIELPAQRQSVAKSATGQIRLRVYPTGTQVVLQVSDDGGGLDTEKLRATAVRLGIAEQADADAMTAEQLWPLIFQPGFSTAHQVTEVSGRGVGMDVVRATVHRLKGSISISSLPGQGTTFTIQLPSTLAIARVLMVQACGQTFAMPLNAVTQILRPELEQLEELAAEPVVRVEGRIYPVTDLGQSLGLSRADTEIGRPLLLMIRTGEQSFALLVDRILEGREVVVKTLGTHLRRIRGVTGATLMGDGSVVLILDPGALRAEVQPQGRARTTASRPVASQERPLEILVVDDSLSVRRVVTNLLRRTGWVAHEAKDGVEALEFLQRAPHSPDAVLLDVEMPRMDGFELTSILRSQSQYRRLPIVMLTSRAGEKHRRKAFEAGATDYVVKPFQDAQLLQTLRRHVDALAAGAGAG